MDMLARHRPISSAQTCCDKYTARRVSPQHPNIWVHNRQASHFQSARLPGPLTERLAVIDKNLQPKHTHARNRSSDGIDIQRDVQFSPKYIQEEVSKTLQQRYKTIKLKKKDASVSG